MEGRAEQSERGRLPGTGRRGVTRDAGPRGDRACGSGTGRSPPRQARTRSWLACSHGDVIKAVVADALGMHLDLFQRINVDPCSVTVIRYAELRSFALRVNDDGGSIDDLLPPKKKSRSRRKPSSDAVVGGGSGA